MQVLCHYLMSFNEFETKEKEWNVEDASLLAVSLENAISIFNNFYCKRCASSA